MALFFMESLHRNLGQRFEYKILVSKNFTLLSKILGNHKNIKLIDVESYKQKMKLVLSVSFSNIVILPPSVGRLPFKLKLFAKFLGFYKGKLLGFDDGSFLNFLFDKVFSFEKNIEYLINLNKLGAELGASIENTPTLSLNSDCSILRDLDISNCEYIVLHCFGSSTKRSFEVSEISYLLNKLEDNFPSIKVVLTGGEKDENEIRLIINRNNNAICGITKNNLDKTVCLIKKCILFLGVDTGTTHIASLIGVKSLVFAHNGSPNWLPFYGNNTKVYYKITGENLVRFDKNYLLKEKSGLRCLDRIEKEVVFDILNNELCKIIKK